MKTITIILFTLCICSAAFCAEEGHAAENPGIFSGTFADALWTVIAFVVLMIVLGKVAWKPILNGLNVREKHIQQQIEDAEKARMLAKKMLEESKEQGLQIIKEATDRAIRHEQELTEKARQEVLGIRRQASEDIEHARKAATDQLWKQAGDIVLTLGSQVLGRKIDDNDTQKMVQEALDKIKE